MEEEWKKNSKWEMGAIYTNAHVHFGDDNYRSRSKFAQLSRLAVTCILAASLPLRKSPFGELCFAQGETAFPLPGVLVQLNPVTLQDVGVLMPCTWS